MLETDEQIALTLEHCGETLTFPSFTIEGIPGHEVGNVQSYDSPYDIDKQEFFFQIASKEALALGIAAKDTFTYTLNTKDYEFKILSIVDDIIGWIELRVQFLGVTSNV